MTVTDKDCADLMMGIYAYSGVAPVDWDHYDAGADDGVCYGVKLIGGTPVIAFRGSTTPEDWLRDFDCVALPFNDADGLGPVHPGFYLGLSRVLGEVRDFLSRFPSAAHMGHPNGPVITGHSLGAGRATLFAGLLKLSGVLPQRRVCFGEPKAGFAQLGAVIGDVTSVSYCAGDVAGHDLVTDVPFSFPPEAYVHPATLTSLVVTPPANDPWGIFRYHHMAGYQAALAAP